MPIAAGLFTSIAILLGAINFVPALHVDWQWQFAMACALSVGNMLIWKHSVVPILSIREAATHCLHGTLIVTGLAIVDIGLGFFFGEKTIMEAFIGSGPMGGIVDAILIAAGLLVGVPTLVMSVSLGYISRHSA